MRIRFTGTAASSRLAFLRLTIGVGLGYDHATLTHFTPEDIACMKALNGIEVLTPGDGEAAAAIVDLAINNPDFRYIRLERQPQPDIYRGRFGAALESGFGEIESGSDVAIVACGALTHKALAAREILAEKGVDAGVIDLFRVKPLDGGALCKLLSSYGGVVTVEEQLLEGGMGGAVAEALIDTGTMVKMKRLGIRDGFEVVNGNRDELHALYGIDIPDMGKELIPQPFPLARPLYQPCDVQELDRSENHLLRAIESREDINPIIRHKDDADVWINGAKRVIRSVDLRSSQ